MKKTIIFILILIAYLIIGKLTGFYLPCPIHEITGFYCPCCGITRMFISIFKLDFYRAFRSNMLVFILLPFATVLYFENIYSKYKKKKSIYDKIDIKVWYILLIIVFLYGVLRNIFPILAPIE